MNIRLIKTPEKRQIIRKLNEQYGIEELPYLLIETGKEKIRGFSGSLSKDEILQLARLTHIEIIGLYLIRKEYDYRLSTDATHLLKDQITKNTIELTEEQAGKWLRGHDLEIPKEKGTYVIIYDNIPLGCGKSNGSVIFNHLPKDRRIRN